MKTPKPWYRKDRDAWFICLHRRQHLLAKGRANKKDAVKACHRLLADDPGSLTDHRRPLTVVRLAKLFLRWLRKHREPRTVEFYLYFLRTFCRGKRRLGIDRLTPEHVEQWLDRQSFNSTTQSRAIGAVKTMLNWAVRKQVLRDNPIRLIQKPPCLRRERILTAAERKTILSRVRGRNFKMFLFALANTGCRPGEAASVTAEHFHPSGLWVLPTHKTKNKTGKPRVIYLSKAMIKLTKLLIRLCPGSGPLFRNDRGNPWTRNSIRCRMRRLRETVKIPELCAYLWRHTYTTDALERGVHIATVAELLGHTSTVTISRHYGHLDQKAEHLRQAVELATRCPGR